MPNMESPFERKLREKRERLAQTQSQPVAGSNPAPAPSQKVSVPEDHIPDLGGDELSLSPEEEQLDEAIKNLSILEAYRIWSGKMTPKYGSGQRESIKISCPDPSHPDKNPSAWINLDKNTYYCSGCAAGGDVWDIAALNLGIRYKGDKEAFRELRRKMATDLGFSFLKSVTGHHILVGPGGEDGSSSSLDASSATEGEDSSSQSSQSEPESDPSTGSSESVAESNSSLEESPGSGVTAILPAAAAEEYSAEEYEENIRNAPTIDWRVIVRPGTYLYEYLEKTTQDTCPEEYHFWNGLVGLGLAIGREVTLNDSDPVIGNLFVCLTGPSSAGKSRSKRHLDKMLREHLPYDNSVPTSRGTKIIKAPNSAEYLISTFTSKEEVQMPGMPMITNYYPVRGLVWFDELAQLMGTANRVGNAIRPQLMELYDAPVVLESGAKTSGITHAEYPFGSLVSTTQLRSMRKLLDKGDDGSGFINRWIFVQGKLKERLPMGGVAVDMTEPGKLLKNINQWAFSNKSLNLSEDAYKAWAEFFYNTVVPTQDRADRSGTAVLGRIDLLMKKLFLLFAANNFETEVSLDSVERVIKLWPYLVKTFGAVNVEMRKTESSDLQDEIISQIKRLTTKNGKAPSRKEIYDCVKRKISTTKELTDLLTVLVKAELIHEVEPPKGVRGRPTLRYEVA